MTGKIAVNLPRSGGLALRPGARMLLAGGGALALGLPLILLEPGTRWASDGDLLLVLRGMAAIKVLLALLAATAVWWRLNTAAASRALVATYVGCTWALTFAAGLLGQLTAIVPASILFHGATITLLIAAWRDIGAAAGTGSR